MEKLEENNEQKFYSFWFILTIGATTGVAATLLTALWHTPQISRPFAAVITSAWALALVVIQLDRRVRQELLQGILIGTMAGIGVGLYWANQM